MVMYVFLKQLTAIFNRIQISKSASLLLESVLLCISRQQKHDRFFHTTIAPPMVFRRNCCFQYTVRAEHMYNLLKCFVSPSVIELGHFHSLSLSTKQILKHQPKYFSMNTYYTFSKY